MFKLQIEQFKLVLNRENKKKQLNFRSKNCKQL